MVNTSEIIPEGVEDKSWVTLSPKTIPMLLEALNNYTSLEEMNLKKKYKDETDNARIYVTGTYINPCVVISIDH